MLMFTTRRVSGLPGILQVSALKSLTSGKLYNPQTRMTGQPRVRHNAFTVFILQMRELNIGDANK